MGGWRRFWPKDFIINALHGPGDTGSPVFVFSSSFAATIRVDGLVDLSGT